VGWPVRMITNDNEEENLMNSEALIGTTLGTCVLQKVIGQGGMGAVYLAQQSRPRRQVAVKVLLPATPLSPNQRVAFLERFRRETDAAASLEHPNIVPVYEYGERDGLAYLVMPYISGGTLREVMEAENTLPLAQIMHYLEQLASALDFAHERGVIHRDIKPANILLTTEGRVLLTDFGLVKIVADGQTPQMRLTGAGAPVGTPDYMSPEQVIGEKVDGRADLYSLGVLMYHMITGLTPFQGETPMQIAAQHLQLPPPAPRLLRPELPVEGEQVLLRVLSKRPTDRYARCQDFSAAFRSSLASAGILTGPLTNTASNPAVSKTATATRLFAPRGLFDPAWQNPAVPVSPPIIEAGQVYMPMPGIIASANNAQAALPVRPTGLLSRAGMVPKGSTGQELLPKSTLHLSAITGTQPVFPSPPMSQLSPSSTQRVTGALAVPNSELGGSNSINTMKLTGPVKVVQLPVAGQPGRYMTGLLPVIPQTPGPDYDPGIGNAPKKLWKTAMLSLLILLITFSAVGSFWVLHLRSTPATLKNATYVSGATNIAATATAEVQATAQSNLILSDPLSQNTNNWPVNAPNETFKDGAYHVYNTGGNAVAVVLPQQSFNMPNAYTLTMWEVRGNDTSNNNSFGLIIRFSQQTKGGILHTSFYSFEVVNIAGGEYRFYKYDDSQSNPWKELWHKSFGSEYHQGQGPAKTNTIKLSSNGSNFTFVVNGKIVGSAQDNSLTTGTLGMLVNLKGTEVAFTNLMVNRN
jgi:serine/threonine protein kinase